MRRKGRRKRERGGHEQSRSAKRAELVTQLAALGYGVPKKRGRPAGKATGVGNGAVRKARSSKVKTKYRDSKTGEMRPASKLREALLQNP